MPTIGAKKKVIFSDDDNKFIKENFMTMTNPDIAKTLGVTLTVLRSHAYKMGLKKIEMEYWTKDQVDYLQNNYKKKGDTEIAQIFNEKYPKNKPWTKKHIEKKRRYLNLKRTKLSKIKIHQKHVDNGVYKEASAKAWQTTRKQYAIGTIRQWGNIPYIKTENGYIQYARYVWINHNGNIDKDDNIYHRDNNKQNCALENLYIVKNHEQGCVNRLSPEKREMALLKRYANKEVEIDGKITFLKVKKIRETTALFYHKRTEVIFNSQIPDFLNRINRNK
jgi:hypothetical protein